MMKQHRTLGLGFIAIGAFIGVWSLTRFFGTAHTVDNSDPNLFTIQMRKKISQVIVPFLGQSTLPLELELPSDGGIQRVAVEYSIQENLQAKSDQILKNYKPDYGAVVLMEAETGRVVALSQFVKGEPYKNQPFFLHPLPAASVFKIVTAAAAIDRYQISPDSLVNFMGGHYTLYKRNVVGPQNKRWSTTVTLREAFARSYNTAFGRLAIENLQPHDLLEYASRFGFHRDIPSELMIPMARTEVPEKADNFQLAEMASGYNKVTQITAVQGAMIAAAVANNGLLMAPSIIDRLKMPDGSVLFENHPLPVSKVFSKESAENLRKMMRATIEIGTSRKSFNTFRRKRLLQEVEVGGKTGSLTSMDPKGKLDWFVGFIQDPAQKTLAVAVVTVHEKLWTVKSAVVAEQLFAHYLTMDEDAILATKKKGRQRAISTTTGQ